MAALVDNPTRNMFTLTWLLRRTGERRFRHQDIHALGMAVVFGAGSWSRAPDGAVKGGKPAKLDLQYPVPKILGASAINHSGT